MTYPEMETAIAAARDGADAFLNIMRHPELMAHMTPDTAAQFTLYCETAAHGSSALFEDRDNTEFTQEFIQGFSGTALGEMILQMPLTKNPMDEQSRPNPVLACEVAEQLGPDHAQALYRFAVLVTKVA